MADTSGNRKKEDDIRALKRLDTETLRQGTQKGRKVIYVWDKAGIDFRQWFKWKYSASIYFISREKENMDLLHMGDFPYDRNDKINKGVESFQLAGTSTGVFVHHRSYKCPITGKSFKFITNLLETLLQHNNIVQFYSWEIRMNISIDGKRKESIKLNNKMYAKACPVI